MIRRMLCLMPMLLWGLVAVAGPADAPARQDKVGRAVLGDDGVQRIEVVGGSYFYNPNKIIVTVNRPVELTLRKESGVVPHDIVMKSPEAGMEFSVSLAGDPQKVRFTPTKVGIYPFHCTKKLLFFESHREKGMEGFVEVVP